MHNSKKKLLFFGAFIFSFLISCSIYLLKLKDTFSLGWDTPTYLNALNILEEEGAYNFLILKKFTYLFYPIFEVPLKSIMGLNLITFENIMPLILLFLFYISILPLIKFYKKGTILFLLLPFWVGLLPMIVSTRANFLALILFFFSLPLFIKDINKITSHYFVFILIMFVLSLTHLESSGFYTLILFLFLLIHYLKGLLKKKIFFIKSILLFIPLIFAITLSLFHSFNTLTFFNYTKDISSSIMPSITYHFYLYLGGPLILMFYILLVISFRKINLKNKIQLIIFLWSFTTFVFFILSLFLINLRIHTLRLIGLLPLPFILIPLLSTLLHNMGKKKRFIIIFLVFIIGMFCLLHASEKFYLPFVNKQSINTLQSLNKNNLSDNSIFILLPKDNSFGGNFVDLWRDWIRFNLKREPIIYVGEIENLLTLNKTIFKDPYLNYKSKEYYKYLSNCSIDNKKRNGKNIIVIKEFYTTTKQDYTIINSNIFCNNQKGR